MLKINFDYALNLRGIKRQYTFFKKLGLSHDVATRMANNKGASIHLGHLTKICEALHCTPNDLLDYKDDNGLASDHPLHSLKKDATHIESIEKLKTLPLNKMNQLKELIEELEKEEPHK